VDIIGDIIVDLDTNWQVAWYWRSFDYLNANRAAILGETCAGNGTSGGCPPLFLINTGVAQDWLHGNALYYTPSDGSILFSMRHQDWIVKIDYGNETGTSDILWTLGQDGDFTINSTDPYPWFSHQHDPGFLQNGTSTLALFDNGNTRVSPPHLGLGSGHSRGYVLSMDYSNMSVTPVMLADLGFFSEALGTAELLANGDYHFEAGYGIGPPTYAEAIEVFPNSTLSLTMKLHGFPCYRSFRMTDLYTPPDKD
jgi:arylsulfate sulfotransferase